jgi:hypothetical protein
MRVSELNKRRTRREKLAKLRQHYRAAHTPEERQQVIEKLSRIAPDMTLERLLAPGRKSVTETTA